jgi:hypothetical protein
MLVNFEVFRSGIQENIDIITNYFSGKEIAPEILTLFGNVTGAFSSIKSLSTDIENAINNLDSRVKVLEGS